MILQNLILPSPETCTEEKMYFRRNGAVDYTWADSNIKIHPDGSVYFDTYFNGFPAGKWGKYTKVNNIYITLKFSGKIRITLVRKERVGKEVLSHYISEKIVESEGEEVALKFDDANYVGIFSFDVLAIEETILYGGYYWSDIDEEDIADVKIALDICTFKENAL